MTLDAIIDQYDQGKLAEQPDLVLHDALVKITSWRSWRSQHPDQPPSEVPPAERLDTVATYIESLSQRRYGCND
ncbi:MAG: hypothetical protein EOO88_08730 [Pedobacter sp.]|nr:MAG: hypothetical protein EOO88_08730 [Pedobacter sp.]